MRCKDEMMSTSRGLLLGLISAAAVASGCNGCLTTPVTEPDAGGATTDVSSSNGGPEASSSAQGNHSSGHSSASAQSGAHSSATAAAVSAASSLGSSTSSGGP